ncbi:hypothetical protein [Rhizobium sp. Root1203]|nr:hypothetical protein [Rhizobium sp. Root1203]
MKSLLALAGIASFALISSFQSHDMAVCLAGHAFDVCHYALNR